MMNIQPLHVIAHRNQHGQHMQAIRNDTAALAHIHRYDQQMIAFIQRYCWGCY